MNATWPKSPTFLFCFVLALLLLSCHLLFCKSLAPFFLFNSWSRLFIYLFIWKSTCNGKLEEAWIVNKSMNCLFTSLVVESSQKSLMILKMLLSLKALSLWSPWHRVSLTLIDKHIILVLNEQNNECLKFKLDFSLFREMRSSHVQPLEHCCTRLLAQN